MEKKVADNGSASERARDDPLAKLKRYAKQVKLEFRYGKSLQRQAAKWGDVTESLYESQHRILRETKDGTLTRKVNEAVLRLGRDRLRGETEDDDLDTGTNRDRSVVAKILDGERPAPDASRFERASEPDLQ